MIFQNAAILILLLFLPLFGILLIWREQVRLSVRWRLAHSKSNELLFAAVSTRFRLLKLTLWLLSILALIIALARPVWGLDLDVIETQGVSVIFLLDVSYSMGADDLFPDRLTRAKLGIRDLLAELEGNEVSLILFAGAAFIQLPLTIGTVSAVHFLNAAGFGSIGRQGTNIPEAIELAVNTFNSTRPSSRIAILFTDGENHEGNLQRAVDHAARANVTIHAIGYGDPEGAPIPVIDENGNLVNYRTDENNSVIFSKLDEDTLRFVTDQTGGIYQRATATGAEIRNLASVIRQAEAGVLESRNQQRGIERFGIFVALALAALSFEIMMPEARSVRP
jgi:Ca-activated chloride channel family protein